MEDWVPPYPKLTAGIIIGTLNHVLCLPVYGPAQELFSNDDLELLISFASNLLWTVKTKKLVSGECFFFHSVMFIDFKCCVELKLGL